MKLKYLYLLIGGLTFLLNTVLTIYIMRRHVNEADIESTPSQNVITFKLKSKTGSSSLEHTTEADDTELIY